MTRRQRAPVTIHQSLGHRIRVTFPDPEHSPFPKVRKAGREAAKWQAIHERADAALHEGDVDEVVAALGFVGSAVDLWQGSFDARSYAHDRRSEVDRLQREALKAALPDGTKVRGHDGNYEVWDKGANIFDLAIALHDTGLSVRPILDFRGTVTSARCTSSCRSARMADCRCSCGGQNHGVQVRRLPLVSASEVPDPDEPGGVLQRREYGSPEPDAPREVMPGPGTI